MRWLFTKYIPIGQKVHQYEVLDCVGEGRFGICYIVRYNGQKYIYKDFKNRERKKSKEKLHFEAEILQKLNSSYFPSLFHVVHEKKKYGLLMEYMEGCTIEAWLFGHKHIFTKDERNKIFLQLLECVSILHHQGIVHRDIRPSNVLYHEGKIALIDFGLARWMNTERYVPQVDFSYLGHFLLYLYYSALPVAQLKKKPWYEELPLLEKEKNFFKRLLGLAPEFLCIEEIQEVYRNIM